MELFSTPWGVISAILAFLCGAIILVKICRYYDTTTKVAFSLYAWHTIFCIAYALYSTANVADAVGYYRSALNGDINFSLGSTSVDFLTYIFVSKLGLSFMGTFLVYNIFGSIGLLAFYSSLHQATANKQKNIRRLAILIVLLPSVSFWSSAIGKDALSFMATGLALWAALNFKRRYWLLGVAIVVMLIVRPHIAGLMVIALTISLMVQSKISFGKRFTLGIISLICTAVLVPFAMHYAGLSDADQLNAYIQHRQELNMGGESSLDISNMSPPVQLFTYLFRPLPFEAHSLFSLAASLDNVIMLCLFIFGGWQLIKHRKRPSSENRTFLWVYSLSTWLILAVTTANLGIATRQKWMFAPMLIFLLISVMGKPRKPYVSNRTQTLLVGQTHDAIGISPPS